MESKRLMIQIFLAAFFVAAIDFIWLGLIAKNFYLRHMAPLIVIKNGSLDVNYLAGLAVYILLAVGLAMFVLPAGDGSSLGAIYLSGALLGLVIYGCYDMTNMATLKTWPLPLAAADMAWGSFVCGTSAVFTQVSSAWIMAKLL
jgi:uncharacterized membrane protein